MTRRAFAFSALCAVSTLLGAPAPQAQRRPAAAKPKLVVGIVIDQFRYDYLTRFRSSYTSGLERLLRNGAVFTNARYVHFPTVTAVGHATFMTGATPEYSGIVNNEWFDHDSGKETTSVSDESTRLLGGSGTGASPGRLLVSTLGDEMKTANPKCRVVGISLKDRAAILPSGHMADGAYWFDPKSGNFVSSTFYFAELPPWVAAFNQARPGDKFAGAEWKALSGEKTLKKMPAEAGPRLYSALEAAPFGNELVEAFAERALDAERLGHHPGTDLLTVSFSGNDYVGHSAGPDSDEVREISIRTDRLLGKFLQALDAKVGLANVVVVMAGDHGVAPVPEVMRARRMPGGRLAMKAVTDAVKSRLAAKFGAGDWIVSTAGGFLYLNHDLVRQKGLDEAAVERSAAEAALSVPHLFRVYTRDQLLQGQVADDPIGRQLVNSFHAARSADVFLLPDPYWMFSSSGTTHGNVFGYDTHVPVILMGPGIRAGRYDANIAPNDIAPTLATMLSVETPSGSVGRVLTEALVK